MEQRFMIDDLRDHNEKLKLQNEILKAEIEKQKIFHNAETCKFEQRISDLTAEVQHLNEQLTESKRENEDCKAKAVNLSSLLNIKNEHISQTQIIDRENRSEVNKLKQKIRSFEDKATIEMADKTTQISARIVRKKEAVCLKRKTPPGLLVPKRPRLQPITRITKVLQHTTCCFCQDYRPESLAFCYKCSITFHPTCFIEFQNGSTDVDLDKEWFCDSCPPNESLDFRAMIRKYDQNSFYNLETAEPKVQVRGISTGPSTSIKLRLNVQNENA